MFPGIESLHRRIITNSGPRHRLPGQPSLGHKRGMHCCLGHLQRECSCLLLSTHTMWLTKPITARFPLSLHLTLAQDSPSVSPRQQGLGVPEIRQVDAGIRFVFDILKSHPLLPPAIIIRRKRRGKRYRFTCKHTWRSRPGVMDITPTRDPVCSPCMSSSKNSMTRSDGRLGSEDVFQSYQPPTFVIPRCT